MNLNVIAFDCQRTCEANEPCVDGLFMCKFNPVLSVLKIVAHSHTAQLSVDYSDIDQLRAAVLAIGGVWIGKGEFQFYDKSWASGYGFHLPMVGGFARDGSGKYHRKLEDGESGHWMFPAVLKADGNIAFDDYKGKWGDISQLARLKAEYIEQSSFVKVEQQAQLLGWQTERQEGKLLVYCPTGGVLTITSGGEVSTAGFAGQGCHQAREALNLPIVEGSIRETAEACKIPATIQQGV